MLAWTMFDLHHFVFPSNFRQVSAVWVSCSMLPPLDATFLAVHMLKLKVACIIQSNLTECNATQLYTVSYTAEGIRNIVIKGRLSHDEMSSRRHSPIISDPMVCISCADSTTSVFTCTGQCLWLEDAHMAWRRYLWPHIDLTDCDVCSSSCYAAEAHKVARVSTVGSSWRPRGWAYLEW